MDLAERASGLIPDCSAAMEKLISSYADSPLARFHRYFYSTEPEPPDLWPRTYDRTDFQQLPPCARFILEHPNDLLLRPSGMRRIVTILLSLGWHPRHVAGFIQSKFEGQHAWGRIWEGYDPATRAEFYTRLFSGLVAARYDDLVRCERLKWAAEALNQVAERCGQLEIGCVFENKLPHLLFARTSDLLWILASMTSVEVGVCLDTGHANLTGDMYTVIQKLSGHLRMVHAHDNHGVTDEHLAPGAGFIEWNRVLMELGKAGFHGGIILELSHMKDMQRLLQEARKAKRLYLFSAGQTVQRARPEGA
jgi:Xylose isomerase-like TIM barrel